MKNSILIIATVVFTFLNVNATNEKMILNTSNEVIEITKDKIVKVYDWTVKTNKGTYSGTSLNLEHANNMITLVSAGEIILEKKVESFFMLNSEVKNKEKRNYFWEVTSTKGYAKGYSSSEKDAHKMIKLVASGDIITSKIIFSQPRQ
ncbi:hypothetical protein [Corallibacter sp.]|uniref:hypothetical protein n=1 Tax=Corallibacter sp. TaxID=2038084 RepID=UPI003AB1831B